MAGNFLDYILGGRLLVVVFLGQMMREKKTDILTFHPDSLLNTNLVKTNQVALRC